MISVRGHLFHQEPWLSVLPKKNLMGKDLLKIDVSGSLLNKSSGLTSQAYSVAKGLNV